MIYATAWLASAPGASLGLAIIGKLLGPPQPTTTARYLDADPSRWAFGTIGTATTAAVDGKPGDKQRRLVEFAA